jgi:hypothetical protein
MPLAFQSESELPLCGNAKREKSTPRTQASNRSALD